MGAYHKKPFKRKPPGILLPNLHHPQLDGCRILLPIQQLTNSQINPITGSTWVGSGVDWVGSSNGAAAYLDSDTDRVSGPSTDYDFSNGEFTVYAHFNTFTGAQTAILGRSNEASGSRVVRLTWDNDATTSFLVGTSGGAWAGDSITWSGSFKEGIPVHFFAYFSNSGLQNIKGGYALQSGTWRNGTAAVITDGPKATTDDIWLANAEGVSGIGHPNGCWIWQTRVYDRALTEAECWSIANNSWAPWERRIWVPVTAVAGATVSPTTGTALLSGKAPTVFRKVSVSPTVGTALLSGKAPTVATEVVATVQPTTGAAVFSGLAPTTFRQVTQAPTTGTALFSGLAPTISAITGVGVSPTTGTALLSGLAPTTFREVAVSPTTGKITYSGVTPTVAAAKTAAPTTGTAIFSGLAPTVTTALLATVQPTTGAALLSGLAPTVSVQRTAAPGAGTAIFSGKAPETSVFVNLTPTTGTAIFSGLAPSAGPFIGTTVSPTVGKMTMAGKAPTATADSIFGVWNPIDEVSSSWIPYTRVTTAWTDL